MDIITIGGGLVAIAAAIAGGVTWLINNSARIAKLEKDLMLVINDINDLKGKPPAATA